MTSIRGSVAPMRVEVFHRRDAAWLRLGSCELPRLQADVIEVLHPVELPEGAARGRLPTPEAHRFSIIRTAGAAGEHFVLMPQDGARPEVLPAWRQASND